jgi:hypothetical protein
VRKLLKMKLIIVIILGLISITLARYSSCSINSTTCVNKNKVPQNITENKNCAVTCPSGEASYCHCINFEPVCVCAVMNEKGKLGCVEPYSKCSTANECCYVCTGVTCYNQICQPNTCLGRGSACDADCQCCSNRCNKSDLDPGNCC